MRHARLLPLLAWVGCLLVAVLLGCQKPTAATPKGNVQTFFPFQEGARWQYVQRNLGGSSAEETFELFFRGVQKVEEVGHELFVIDEVVPRGTSPTGYFFQDGFLVKVLGLAYNKQGTIVWQGKQLRGRLLGGPPGNVEKFLPATLAVGARWQSHGPVLNALVEADYHVVSQEAVEVPAGRYPDCFRIESSTKVSPIQPDGNTDSEAATTFSSTDWYAAGVGLVKSQMRQEGQDTGELVLLRYEKS
ncbi:MAG: TapB family protein [Candidatus Binatia bacterium]